MKFSPMVKLPVIIFDWQAAMLFLVHYSLT